MRALTALLALLAALLLGACGGDDDDAGSAAPATTATQEAAAFPVTVEHEFGSTTIEREPERIVVVGLTEQDTLLALGMKPVATTEWYGDQPGAIWPWARAAMGDAEPEEVLSTSDGFEFEKIAALRPDLIIGTNAGMDKAAYAKLSRLAPTVATPKGGERYFGPWDDQTELIAKAVGKEAEGKALVADIKDRFAAVAAEHPEWRGKTATFIQNGFYNGLIYAYPAGLNTEFLDYLGFTINPKLTPLIKKPGEQVAISPERLDVVEADVIVWATEKAADITNLKKEPTFEQVPAVAEGRSVYTDGTLAGAIYFMSPLSLPYVLEKLTPQLEAAVKGGAPMKMMDPSGS